MSSLTLTSRQKNRKLPQVDVPVIDANDEMRRFSESIKEHLRMYEGDSGAPKERFVTIEELEHVGLVTTKVQQGFASIDKVLGEQVSPVPSVSSSPSVGGGGTGGVRTLRALDDTKVDGIKGGQGIVFNGIDFVPTNIPDFDLGNATRYDMMYFDGSKWKHTKQELQWNPNDDYLQLANDHSVNWLDTSDATQDFVNFTSIGAAGAAVGHIVKHLNAGVTTTSATYQDVTGAVVTYAEMEANEDYVVFVRAYVGNATDGNQAGNGVQLTKGGVLVTGSEMIYESPHGVAVDDNGMLYYWAGVVDSGGSGDLQLQIKSGNDGVDTVFANNVSIMMIKIGELVLDTDIFHSTNTAPLELDTNYAGTGAQITIGDGESDWLVFGSTSVNNWYAGAGNMAYMEIYDGSTSRMGSEYYIGDITDQLSMGVMHLYQGIASTTLSVRAKSQGFAIDEIYSSIIAVRVSAFNDYQADFTAASGAFAGGPGNTDVCTVAFSAAASDDYCLLACGTGTSGAASDAPDPLIHLDLNTAGDTTVAGELDQEWSINSTHSQHPHWVVAADQTWSVSDAVDADFNVEHGSSGSAEWFNNFLIVFSWTLTGNDEELFDVGNVGYTTRMKGLTTRFYDTGLTDYVEFDHDDTDFNITGFQTADINITGITAINAGTVDLDVDALSSTTLQFDIAFSDGSAEGRLQWNSEDGTLEVGMPGGNVNLQIGQEHLIRCRNTTGVQIDNGSVVEAIGSLGGKLLIGLADASAAQARVIGMATEDIGHNSNGYVTIRGLVRDIDTDGLTLGDPVFLSETTPGAFTPAPPTPPNHFWAVGLVVSAHASTGSMYVSTSFIAPLSYMSDVDITGIADNEILSWDDASSTWLNALVNLDNLDADILATIATLVGQSLDQTDVSVSSDGGTITFTLEQDGGGDIRFLFSDGVHTHDCTDPIASIALTAGTDTSPTLNYVYILQSDKLLTKSTAGWPATEHARLATVFCQSAASLQTDGAYKMHAWTDHSWDNELGHIAHNNFWIRSQPATWVSGTLCSTSVGAATFDIAVATGEILQLHPHAYPAFNTATGSEIMLPNQNGTAYDRVGNMVSQITDANGVTMSGKYYNLIVWGVVSEDDADCQLMVNLPTASYNTSASAVLDSDATTVYDIPTDFIGTGFLIARLICRHQVSGNTYTIVSNVDLRGTKPSTSAGGTVGGGVTTFGDLSDADDTGVGNNDMLYYAAGVWVDTGGALTFDGTDFVCGGDVSGLTIGGITEANLVDKSASETVTGMFSFTNSPSSSLDGSILLDQATVPILGFRESGAAATNQVWDIAIYQESMRFRTADDAGGANVTWMQVERTGTTVDSIALTSSFVSVNGQIQCPHFCSGDATSGITLAGGTAGNGANIELYGQTHAGVPNQAFYDGASHTFRTIAAGTGFVIAPGTQITSYDTFAQIGTFRHYDAGATDYNTMSHDGTNYNSVFTNTTNWNINGANVQILTGNQLSLLDSTNADVATFQHDGTDFNLTTGGTTDFTVDVPITSQSNYLLEGYATQRNVLRTMTIRLDPGATPGTNYNITFDSARSFNLGAAQTGATNMVASTTNGSFTSNANSRIMTYDSTEQVIGIVAGSVQYSDANNSTSHVMLDYHFSSSKVKFSLTIPPSNVTQNMATMTSTAGDFIILTICYVTNS